MGMTNFEFFAIVVFVMAVFGALAWKQIKRTGMEAEARNKLQESEAANVVDSLRLKREDEQVMNLIAADHYNEACNAVGTGQYKRRLNAGIANQAASMEPFCGEGKKP